MLTRCRSLLLGGLLIFPLSASSFYLPGAAPHDYATGDQVNLFVNALTPMLSGTNDAKLVCTVYKNVSEFFIM